MSREGAGGARELTQVFLSLDALQLSTQAVYKNRKLFAHC